MFLRSSTIRTSIPAQLSESQVAKTATHVTDSLNKKVKKGVFKSKRHFVRYGLVTANVILVLGVAVFLGFARSSESPHLSMAFHLNSSDTVSNPLDSLSSADIAVTVARMTNMPQTTAVINHADSANTSAEIVPNGSQAIAKPQILKTELKSKNDIEDYIVAEGDSVDSLAQKFGVSSNSIRWSNGVTGSTLQAGTKIVIPPVDGIVYTVKSGDTANSLAGRFRSNEARIVAFNDAEISGFVEGERIVIPDGEVIPVARSGGYSGSGVAYGFVATYGPANGYDFGWCTWHAANRRMQVGSPVPTNLGNAVTWGSRARAAGMTVSDVPIAGAVIWHDQSVTGYVAGGLGHVAYVESVNADGSIIVSDMNSRGVANPDLSGPPAGGWARVSYRLVTPEDFYKYDFIY